MIDIVNRVSNSLLSAHAQSKLADVAFGVFEVAKARGVNSVMDRAMSYATPEISDALKHTSDINDDLKKAQEEARMGAKKEAEKQIKEQPEKSIETNDPHNAIETQDASNTTHDDKVTDTSADAKVYMPDPADSTPVDMTGVGQTVDVKA